MINANGVVMNLSGDQIQQMLIEDIREIKNSLKELSTMIVNLRVELAEDYVRKSEHSEEIRNLEKQINKVKEEVIIAERNCLDKIEEHKKEERSYNMKALGVIATATGSALFLIQWVYSLAKG